MQIVTHYRAIVFTCITIVILTVIPPIVEANQIAPNPNPAGSTIDIVNDPSAFNSANPFVNAGTIDIGSASTLTNNTGAALNSTGSINNDGTLINNTGAAVTNSGTGTLTNNGTLTNAGSLANVAGGTLTNNGTVTNSGGLFTVGTLTNNDILESSGNLTINGGSVTNNGTFINTGTVSTPAGLALLTNAGSGTLENFGGISLTESTANNAGVFTNHAGASLGLGDANLNNSGLLTNAVGGSVSMTLGGISNSGTVANAGQLLVGPQGSLTNSGTLSNTGTVIVNDIFSNLINRGTLTNSGTLTNNGTLTNAATLTNSGSINGTGTYLQTAGQTINNGTLTQTSIAINGGVLSGTGTITGNVAIGSGIVSPGSPFGTLTVNGNLSSTGTSLFEIGGLGAGQFDVLNINGGASFSGGTMEFDFLDFTPAIGNSWNFLFADTLSGFNTLAFSFTGLGAGESTQFSFLNGVETLTIVGGGPAVPETNPLLLLLLGLVGVALWRKLVHI